ncbi:citrate lyase subunit alpha [Clostridium estertheticum]|uniref:citrate lyase subunit alpha n=1 Tax=Clostridium estertheticum TaxID=238834 RepID=UPI001C0DB5B2|nr:citrate lyase subunit alpha [Clostridium estertheticum]MBU3217313.1 citrate lyase subunit alpha [Clostridium estertheticum]WAG55819.1 citrate lyase subunit alpha [Clostridium estertheticum]
MKNILEREIPEYIEGYGKVIPFEGAFKNAGSKLKKEVKLNSVIPDNEKVLPNMDSVFDKVSLKDGMTISFHHHLRNGDNVLNLVVDAIAKRGIKNITLAASALFPNNFPLIKHIKNGVITRIVTNYMSGPIAEEISRGILKTPVIMHTHGGRARAIESGDLHIDVAFIAAPTADNYGNINGLYGKSACGALGYAVADAQCADMVVAVTDNLVPYPACPIEISQIYVDYIVKIDSIGDLDGIVSGTTKITKDPVGLKIAKMASDVMVATGLVKNEMSFQTGAGGISLAVAAELRKYMKENAIVGSFASGGITGYLVDMFEEGLFRSLFDVQCFDMQAIKSYVSTYKHQRMSASMYANPDNKGAVVNKLDIVILGATEIDTNFNVNVTTGSDGTIMGGSGGHSDTASGAKLTIIVTQLTKARLPIIKDNITTITTPGESIDVIVTERGVAVNPKRTDIIDKLKNTNLPIRKIGELKDIAEKITGKPEAIEFSDEIVAVIEYRDGSVIDVVRKPL